MVGWGEGVVHALSPGCSTAAPTVWWSVPPASSGHLSLTRGAVVVVVVVACGGGGVVQGWACTECTE